MTRTELKYLWQRVGRLDRIVALLKRLARCQTFLQIDEVQNLLRNEMKQNVETTKQSKNGNGKSRRKSSQP